MSPSKILALNICLDPTWIWMILWIIMRSQLYLESVLTFVSIYPVNRGAHCGATILGDWIGMMCETSPLFWTCFFKSVIFLFQKYLNTSNGTLGSGLVGESPLGPNLLEAKSTLRTQPTPHVWIYLKWNIIVVER